MTIDETILAPHRRTRVYNRRVDDITTQDAIQALQELIQIESGVTPQEIIQALKSAN